MTITSAEVFTLNRCDEKIAGESFGKKFVGNSSDKRNIYNKLKTKIKNESRNRKILLARKAESLFRRLGFSVLNLLYGNNDFNNQFAEGSWRCAGK